MRMPGEFQMIRDYFRRDSRAVDGQVLGIGDDGAILRPRAGFDQVVVTDTLVEGRHFPRGLAAADVGWRALAVNLSDIAAMAATPRFAFLNLTLETPEAGWVRDFAAGFFELADLSGTALAGGDTTQGPLTISVTVIGDVPAGKAVTRASARPGDIVCISGAPGEAAAGLELLQRGVAAGDPLVTRFRRPMPRLALGAALRGVATAMIDISDGLIADLGHVLEASGVGATIRVDALPVSAALAAHSTMARDYVLAGGDDYELCFCLPAARLDELRALADCPVSVIGEIVEAPGCNIVAANGEPYVPARRGWEHFTMDVDA